VDPASGFVDEGFRQQNQNGLRQLVGDAAFYGEAFSQYCP